MLTEGEDGAAAAGEDAQCTVVRPPGRVLDAGCEDTGGTGDHGALDAGLESIDRVVDIIITVGRHFSGVVWGRMVWRSSGMSVRKRLLESGLGASPSRSTVDSGALCVFPDVQ